MIGIDLAMRSIDRYLDGIAETSPNDADGSVRFIKSRVLSPSPIFSMFEEDRTSAECGAERQFKNEVEAARNLPIGMLEFSNVYLAMHTGAILDIDNRTCWYGNAIGWGRNLLISLLEAQFGTTSEPKKQTIRIDSSAFSSVPHRKQICLVSAAGYSAYGHWLLDVIPRLRAFKTLGMASSDLFAPAIGDWGRQLAGSIGIEFDSRYIAPIGHLLKVDRLYVPSFIRFRSVLDRESAVGAWSELASGLGQRRDQSRPAAKPGNKIYVSRARWSRGRTLVNNREVEDWMIQRGYRVLDPQNLSLREQLRIFSCASEVVGEDGSGLHNVVFSRPGIRLRVITMGRVNVFHVGIANAKQQRLGYVEASPTGDDGGWALPLQKVQEVFG